MRDGHYYNEFDPRAAEWLRELMKAGLIPEGVVDERPIQEVRPADVTGFRQCHFFAGIGGWPHALRLAGWPADRPVWTGSCPCQPFSTAGKGKGEDDPRHLWPEFRRLVAECRPPVVLGEQVASAAGRLWYAGVRSDLEALGYAVGAADLCAAGAGAPHIRQRLFWVADAGGQRRQQNPGRPSGDEEADGRAGRVGGEPGGHHVSRRDGPDGGVGDPVGPDLRRHPGNAPCPEGGGAGGGEVDGAGGVEPVCPGSSGGLGDPGGDGREQGPAGPPREEPDARRAGVVFWSAFDLVHCRDGKARRCPQPGLLGLADGLSADLDDLRAASNDGFPLSARKIHGRAGLLRGYGNAIVPELAAEFIMAYEESRRAIEGQGEAS